MASGRWHDALLDRMRDTGDAPADEVIHKAFLSGQQERVRALVGELVDNDDHADGSLPRALFRMLEDSEGPVSATPPAQLERGQQVFVDYGPEILLVLLCYSLPAAYAASNGVQVLHRTGYLEGRPNRRVYETAQMIIDVMSPGGLGPGGRGIRSAQKVRLMHAAVRHLIQSDETNPWDPAWGVPINQEDLAGTLTTFTWLIMDGLEKLEIVVPEEAQQSYLDTWAVVARTLGIREELIPASVAEARELTELIQRRQIRASLEGQQMTGALLATLEENIPGHAFDGLGASLVRHFLPREVADGLGVPEHELADRLVDVFAHLAGELDHFIHGSDRRLHAFRRFSLHLIEWLLTVERGGRRAAFALPVELRTSWQLRGPASEKTFWQRLREHAARAARKLPFGWRGGIR